MQRSTLRPGTPKPRLSDLLHRRNQTVQQYADEFGIAHDVSLEMHCVMHGVVKDITLLAPTKSVVVKVAIKLDVKETEKAVASEVAKAHEKKKEKPKQVKNALVDLTDLVHAGHSSSDPSDEG